MFVFSFYVCTACLEKKGKKGAFKVFDCRELQSAGESVPERLSIMIK